MRGHVWIRLFLRLESARIVICGYDDDRIRMFGRKADSKAYGVVERQHLPGQLHHIGYVRRFVHRAAPYQEKETLPRSAQKGQRLLRHLRKRGAGLFCFFKIIFRQRCDQPAFIIVGFHFLPSRRIGNLMIQQHLPIR